MKAVVLLDEQQVLNDGRYCILLKVFQVKKSRKFPDGIKARFVMIDLVLGKPILLVDNHGPFGFHLHRQFFNFSQARETLPMKRYEDALEYFLLLVRQRIHEK